jgi:hypothetical protein
MSEEQLNEIEKIKKIYDKKFKTWSIVIVVSIITILILSMNVFGITQDEYCSYYPNITFAHCNDIWNIVNQQSNTTIINNYTQDNITIINYIDAKYTILENKLIKINYSLQDEIYSRQDNDTALSKRISVSGDECDEYCQAEKDYQAELDKEAKLQTFCKRYPKSEMCKTEIVAVQNTTIQNNEQLNMIIESLKGLADSNENLTAEITAIKTKPKEDYTNYVKLAIIIIIVIILAVFKKKKVAEKLNNTFYKTKIEDNYDKTIQENNLIRQEIERTREREQIKKDLIIELQKKGITPDTIETKQDANKIDLKAKDNQLLTIGSAN